MRHKLDHSFEVEVTGLGMNRTGYPGAFTGKMNNIINELTSGRVLNLFSGSSLIGEERVDLTHPNATLNMDVREFILEDTRHWDWVILDPPYTITREKKLRGYGKTKAVASNVRLRNELRLFFQEHATNVLWLDICAPMVKNFKRRKLWLLLPGGFHTVRILSWLVNQKT